MKEDMMLQMLKLTLDKCKKEMNINTELFTSTLYYLLNSKDEEDFMKRYNSQKELNSLIKLPSLENCKLSLNEMKCLSIDFVIEFYEDKLGEAS